MQHFLTTYGNLFQLIVFLLTLWIGWIIENAAGLRMPYSKWKHAFLNATFSLTNLPGQLILGTAFIKTIRWTSSQKLGLLWLMPFRIHAGWSFLFVFICLDLGEYIYHVVMHKVKRLWMFHIVHHSDHQVDVSTTFREHPGENLIRLSFTLLWVVLSGATFWMLVLRQLIQAVSTLVAHLNYRLPDRADSILGLVFITPNLHQVHHHYQQPYTDCNYGDVLSIWDRLFGTFRRLPAPSLCFGVDTFMAPEDTNSFRKLLALPFRKYRSPAKRR